MPEKYGENEILKKLSHLGLRDKESKVYLALLSRGYVGTSALIAATGLHSQYVYDGLIGLEEKGLVHHVLKNGRKKFAAQSPKHLEVLVQEKKRAVDALIPQLLSLSGRSDLQSFEVYQGVESFKAEEFQKLKEAPVGSRLHIIGDEGQLFYEVMGEDLEEYECIRVEKKIHLRHIASMENKERNIASLPSNKFFEMRTLEGLLPGRINTNIWDDRVSFNIYSAPVITFSISNKEIAENYLNFFNALWEKCDPV